MQGLSRPLLSWIASFLSVREHLTRFALVCPLWTRAAQSPRSWPTRTETLDRCTRLSFAEVHADLSCPFKCRMREYAVNYRHDGEAWLAPSAFGPCHEIVRLVDKYNFDTSVLDLTIGLHFPTLHYVVNALSKSTSSVQHVILLVRNFSPEFSKLWGALSRLPRLHTVTLSMRLVMGAPGYWRNGKRSPLLHGCKEPMVTVRHLILANSTIGPRDRDEVVTLCTMFPNLETLDWQEASLLSSSDAGKGAVALVSNVLRRVDHFVVMERAHELAQCQRLEQLSITNLPEDFGSWQNPWPRLTYLELFNCTDEQLCSRLYVLASLQTLVLLQPPPRIVEALSVQLAACKVERSRLPFTNLIIDSYQEDEALWLAPIRSQGVVVTVRIV